MHRPVVLKAALVQAAAVAVLSIVLAAALGHDFFVDWGWLAGPAAWIACSALTARALALPALPALAGAALAGLPSLAAVALGVHWLGRVSCIGEAAGRAQTALREVQRGHQELRLDALELVDELLDRVGGRTIGPDR